MNKTEIYLLLSIVMLLLICAYSICLKRGEKSFQLLYVSDGYASTSVNTAAFRRDALCTKEGKEYISFYDKDGYLTLGERFLKDTAWSIQKTQYKGEVTDAHRTISIAVDDSGYLHVAFNHHDSPLSYTRSVEPYSLQLDTLMPMTGMREKRVTYPEFYPMDTTLLFVYRDGASGRGSMIMNRYNLKEKNWERVQSNLIDGEGERSAYWQMCTSRQGTIHVSWVWRESWLVETNHDMCYACSHDGGKTWEKSDGTDYELPITLDNSETIWEIPQSSELINQTSMTVDGDDNPYIATYWCDKKSGVPQYKIIYKDGEGWKMQQVSNRKQEFSLSGGGTKMIPIARPKLLVKDKKAWLFVREEEYGGMAAMYCTKDIKVNNARWKRKDLTSFTVNAWEPIIDYTLWQEKGKIVMFVENTMQGDGEKVVENEAQGVYVLMME